MTRRNREDVIRAAGRLFAERGFHGTSMRDLGDALGLHGSSLYAHVGSKNELLEDLVADGVRRCLALSERVLTSRGTPSERLAALVVGHVELVVANLDTWSTFVNEYRFLAEEERARVVKLRDEYQDAYRQVLEAGVAAGQYRADLDIHLSATVLLSLLNAIPGWYRPGGGQTAAEIGGAIVAVVEGGIRA
jgi:AcrR family transcriptional regulator